MKADGILTPFPPYEEAADPAVVKELLDDLRGYAAESCVLLQERGGLQAVEEVLTY
jgi:hypothetical protein